ncbi:cupin-like domain containing protein [Nitzschia inconspicua]|uniref:Cupin-like domain containing protein n=1 Tax=Nitzschia inconspicua TaxID=303405 RepID=A0A9K3L5Z3_9STRA|nr:cupin-like domain containing protein [Nitzschia inconspicua]
MSSISQSPNQSIRRRQRDHDNDCTKPHVDPSVSIQQDGTLETRRQHSAMVPPTLVPPTKQQPNYQSKTLDPRKIKGGREKDDVSLALVVGAVVCVATMVAIAVSVLLYLLILHGYISTSSSDSSYEEQQQQQRRHPVPNDRWFPVIPSSRIYTIPFSMAHIGDKSNAYAKLRLEWDEQHPPDDPHRSLAAMNRSRSLTYDSLISPPHSSLPYDIYNCPETPPSSYPHHYSTVQLLKHWPPSQNLPSDGRTAHLALCVFDYRKDYIKALKYRRAEVPFVVRNDPRVAETVERWSDESFRHELFGRDQVLHRAERSDTLQFLYWRPDIHAKRAQDPNHPAVHKTPSQWKEPTKLVQMTYAEWYSEAQIQQTRLDNQHHRRNESLQQFHKTAAPYYYFRLIGCGETGPHGDCDKIDTSEYLFDELPFFQPQPQQLYLTDPWEQRGIHCRFGMPGIIAENHFDSSRNAIVILGGQRRYILSHPRYCKNMALFPLGHPSGRHSQINWTNVAFSNDWEDTYPEFRDSMSNEVILQSGDVLYLPTNWFHFIVSLSVNYQCNTRSGRTTHYDPTIRECGFGSTAAPLPVISAASCIQTNFGDASYAGGIAYDPRLGVVYVTGQVGPSSCFVGVLKQTPQQQQQQQSTTNNNDGDDSGSLRFLSKHVFAESAICQTLALRTDQSGTPLLLSVMEEGGILTETRPTGSQKSVQYGGMIELQFNADGSSSMFSPDRGVLFHQARVQIPRSIVTDPNVPDRVFVATMTSESSALLQDGTGDDDNSIPNFTPSGKLKYGNNFAMTIESLRLASSGDDTSSNQSSTANASPLWKKPFGVAGDSSGVGALVNQIIFHGDDQLIVVGSTQGSGFAYGEGTDATMAGFIAKFSPDHGQLQMSRRFHVEMESTSMHTYIEAVCQADDDPDSLYIVGGYHSDGDNRKVPFVAKLATSSLDTMWQQTFPATTNAYALGCGISKNGGSSTNGQSESALYVAGIVEDGGEIKGKTTSHSNDDVFVIQLGTLNGSTLWMTQLGTSGNDRLAYGGSGLIVLDDNDSTGGGVLLMGETTGNLYTTSSQPSEIFVVHVDPQGKSPDSSEVSGIDYSQGQATIGISTPSRIGSETAGSNSTNGSDAAVSGSGTEAPDASSGDDASKSDSSSTAENDATNDSSPSSIAGERMYFLMAIIIFIFLGVCCYTCFQQREKERITQRELVFGYLQAFDVEDMDVRHSATGGWHGTYIGKLAKGNIDFENDTESFEYSDDLDFGTGSAGSHSDDDSSGANGKRLSGFSHSSIVKDSLFVDYDTKPTYGENTRRKSTYLNNAIDDDEEEEGDETSSFVRNPRFYSDQPDDSRDREFSLARLSRKAPGDNQHALDPWGKEII